MLSRDLIVASISHDLNTPISVVKMAMEVLSPQVPAAKENLDLLAMVHENLNKAQGLIHDLLDVYRVESGAKLKLNLQRVDAVSLLRKEIDGFRNIGDDQFVLNLEEDSIGYWDPDLLLRAFTNLTSNAIKYRTTNSPVTIS